MEGRDRLLRRSDQVLVVLRITIDNLIELFIELLKLRSLAHVLFPHELRGLKWCVATAGEKFQAVIDQSLIEKHTPLTKEVASVPNNFDTTFGVVAIKSQKNLMVG